MNFLTARPSRMRCWLLAGVVLLAGCGGVDSGGTGTGNGPLPPTLAVGPISGFGSIIVNGVRYDDTQAEVADEDGQPLDRARLGLGMQTVVQASAVDVVGGVSRAAAASITVRSTIVGPVEALGTNGGPITVLGQRVAIVPATFFDGAMAAGLSALAVGDIVEVHAEYDPAAGRFVASRIEGPVTAAQFRVRGPVDALSLTDRTLTIGTAVIDWSGVAPADPAVALAPGRTLRVTLDPVPTAGIWRATALRAAPTVLEDRDRVEIEGRITALRSATDFDLNGFRVDASAAVVEGNAAALVLGAKVEAKGSARGGVLVATRLELEDDGEAGPVELQGTIVSVDAGQRRFVVRGVTVAWNDATRFDSSTPQDLRAGRHVEIHGSLSDDGTTVVATTIHVGD